MSMSVLDHLLPNPALDTDARAAELRSQMLMFMKLKSLFTYSQEES